MIEIAAFFLWVDHDENVDLFSWYCTVFSFFIFCLFFFHICMAAWRDDAC